MTADRQEAKGVIWQGYHHAWEYNHRVNRLGSFVEYREGSDGKQEPLASHTAASGTGGDYAHFTEFATEIEAPGVGFQAGWGETVVECPRAETALFRIKVDDLELAPALRDKDQYTVVINGFDLIAGGPAGKILSFDLEITDPIVRAGGSKLRFNILGSLAFDCRSTECNMWPFRLESEDVRQKEQPPIEIVDTPPPPVDIHRHKRGIPRNHIGRAVNWLKRQIVTITDLDQVRESMVGEDPDALKRNLFRVGHRRFFIQLYKWRVFTPYTLRVHYMVVAGNRDSLNVAESDFFQNSYSWGIEEEIHLAEEGEQKIEVKGDDPQAYAFNTLAFKHMNLKVTPDDKTGTTNPVQWGKGMHFLEWSVALRDVQAANGQVTANLDMFYKCWSKAMNAVLTLTTWGAYRAAGSAQLGTRLTLLQFKKTAFSQQYELPGYIHWPGGNLSASRDPRACFERPVEQAKTLQQSGTSTGRT